MNNRLMKMHIKSLRRMRKEFTKSLRTGSDAGFMQAVASIVEIDAELNRRKGGK